MINFNNVRLVECNNMSKCKQKFCANYIAHIHYFYPSFYAFNHGIKILWKIIAIVCQLGNCFKHRMSLYTDNLLTLNVFCSTAMLRVPNQYYEEVIYAIQRNVK